MTRNSAFVEAIRRTGPLLYGHDSVFYFRCPDLSGAEGLFPSQRNIAAGLFYDEAFALRVKRLVLVGVVFDHLLTKPINLSNEELLEASAPAFHQPGMRWGVDSAEVLFAQVCSFLRDGRVPTYQRNTQGVVA